jgi:DNA polymerase II small subunit
LSLDQIESIVYELTKKGFQLDPRAYNKISEFLKLNNDIDLKKSLLEIVEEKKKADQTNIFINESDIHSLFPKKEELINEKLVYDEIQAEIKLVRDPGNDIKMLEGIDGFKNYFLDRYNKLMKIVNSRPFQKTITKIEQVNNNTKNIRVAGLVKEKKVSKEKTLLEIEDDTGVLRIIAKSEPHTQAAIEALLDQMLIVDISTFNGGVAFASRIEFPEIPDRIFHSSSPEIYALLLSDLHIGSKTFQKEAFEHLLHWLKGYHGERDIVKKIKYIIIAGDIVDGVGVYPHQDYDLEISNINEQYLLAAQYIDQLPKNMQIIIIPGNHDAIRQALPQPSIPKKYSQELYRLQNVKIYGNPLEVKLHGVNFLIYHGRSLDDVFAYSATVEAAKPENAMKTLLRARHLAPIFGGRTIIAPSEEDTLVIENPPDVFHAGHVHVFGYSKYRGTLIVNSGTFQGQTAHQKSIGINPTPGIAAIINLKSLEIFEKDFNKIAIIQ